jgi:hypothetical protein
VYIYKVYLLRLTAQLAFKYHKGLGVGMLP